MFDFSFGELLVVAVVGLLVLGPKEFPVVLRYLRGIIRSLRETSEALRAQVDEMLDMEDMRAATRFIKGEDGKLYESFGLMEKLAPPQKTVASEAVAEPEPSLENFYQTYDPSAEITPPPLVFPVNDSSPHVPSSSRLLKVSVPLWRNEPTVFWGICRNFGTG